MKSEIKQIFLKYQDIFEQSFTLIEDAYNNSYDWPEMDTLRNEACLCIAFGLNQAAITLCNHILESLLKFSLIYNSSINTDQKSTHTSEDFVKQMTSYTEKGINKYGDMTLNQTINEAHTQGLIDDEEKDKLHEFRKIFRNAYSHADKKKTFGDSTIAVQSAKIESESIETSEPVDTTIADMPIIQSILQAMQAVEDAPYYFNYLDKLVRRIKKKVFPNS